MSRLYRCDGCTKIDDVKKALNITIIMPGQTFKQQKRMDLCEECVRKYLNDTLIEVIAA